jgi:hypothetical protein
LATFSRRSAWNGDNVTQGEQIAANDDLVSTDTRRGALATMLAGSALGLAALSNASTQGADAKKNGKGKGKGKKNRDRNKNGKNGKAKSESENSGNGSLPSIQYVSEENTISADGVFSGFVRCPQGYLPIGGGFDSTLDDALLLASAPGPGDREWTVEIDNAVDGETLTVFAVCLEAKDDTPDDESDDKSRGRKRRSRKR